MGRVDLSEQWRPYSRLLMQQPEGPPLSKMQKLRVRGWAAASCPVEDALIESSCRCQPYQSLPLNCRRPACRPAYLRLQDSLAGHLPAAEQPAEVGAFLDRVQQQIEARWRVSLPPAAPLQAASAAPLAGVQLQAPPAEPKQEMEQQQGQQGALQDLGGGSLPAVGDPAAAHGGDMWLGAAAGFSMQ